MKLKCFFSLSIIILLIPRYIYSQQSTTKLKTGFETGRINTERFGSGLLFRPFLKINGLKNFKKSALKIKTNVSTEILDLQNTISGVHLFANIEYILNIGREVFWFSGSAKNQAHFIQSLKKQLYNEIIFSFRYSHNFSKIYSLQFKKQILFREQKADLNNSLSKNIFHTEFGIRTQSSDLWKLGFFYEKIDFDFARLENRRQNRSGPLLEFNHKKLLVFNLVYKFGFYQNSSLRDHQINVLAGKYLSSKTSLFFFAYYLWRLNQGSQSENLEFTPLESYNNISIKLGYDLKEQTHIFAKLLYEEQEIFRYGNNISTFQVLVGVQQSF